MTGTGPPLDDADPESDSLTRAFDESADGVAAFVDRLDAANDLLGAAARGVRALRGDADADVETVDPAAVAERLNEATDGSAPDEAARLAEVVGRDGDELAAAAEAAAQLHREGALSGATDALTGDDAVRVAEALLDAYRDPEIEGGVGYLVAAVNALGRDGGPGENESGRDAA